MFPKLFKRSTSANTFQSGDLVGIWRLGENVHSACEREIWTCQPCEAKGSPRMGYAIRLVRSPTSSEIERFRSFDLVSHYRHEALIKVVDVCVEGIAPHVVTDLLSGNTLQDRLASGRCSSTSALHWMRQISDGLFYLHQQNVVLGGIHPSEILVTSDNRISCTELGYAAKAMSVVRGRDANSDSYVGPECIGADHAALPASDIFAFGRLLFDVLSHVDFGDHTSIGKLLGLVDRSLEESVDRRPTALDFSNALAEAERALLAQIIHPFASRVSARRAA